MLRTVIPLVASTVVAALPAAAFECAKARSDAEKAICVEPAAKASDDAMSGAFAALRGTMDVADAKMLLMNQRTWLKTRDGQCVGDGSRSLRDRAACFATESAKRTQALAGRPEAGPDTVVPLRPVFVERPGSAKTYAVSLMLYRFTDRSSPSGRRLDAWTDAEIAKAPTKTDDPSGTFSYSYDRQARIAYASDRLLSLAVSGYEFTGGAHGQSTATALNLDLRDGRILTIGDLLGAPGISTVTASCSDEIGAELRRRMTESGQDPTKDTEARALLKELDASAREGLAPIVRDLSNWSFGADAATVTAVTDAIAPHAFGEFTCTVPYRTLRPLAKSDFPLP